MQLTYEELTSELRNIRHQIARALNKLSVLDKHAEQLLENLEEHSGLADSRNLSRIVKDRLSD